MKTSRILLVLAIFIWALESCSVDTIRISSDDEVTFRDIELRDFDAVEIANNMNAYITFNESNEEEIRIEANDELHEYIIVRKEGSKLIVKLKNNLSIRGKETLNVHITTNSINNYKVIADSKIILQNPLITNTAKVTVSADSYFSGEVDLNYLDVNASADATIDLFGTINTLNADLAADAKLLNYDLVVQNLKIDMAADCDARLTINNTIDIDAAADCILKYKGNATIVHQSLKADSRIEKVN